MTTTMRHIRVTFLPISSALSFCPDAPAMLRATLLALWLAVSVSVVGAAPWLVDGRPAPAAHQAVNILAAAVTEGQQIPARALRRDAPAFAQMAGAHPPVTEPAVHLGATFECRLFRHRAGPLIRDDPHNETYSVDFATR